MCFSGSLGRENFLGKRGFQSCFSKGDDLQFPFGPGHSHIEQPALLLIGLQLLLGCVLIRQILGQQSIRYIHQDHPLIFQALAGVDGGEHEGAHWISGTGLYHLPQLF